MGNVLAFRQKEVVRAEVEVDGPEEEDCDECSKTFPIEKLYLDHDGKLICKKCVPTINKDKDKEA